VQSAEHKAAGQAAKLRVPQHALAAGRVPQPGEAVEISFLMQQVTGCKVVADQA